MCCQCWDEHLEEEVEVIDVTPSGIHMTPAVKRCELANNNHDLPAIREEQKTVNLQFQFSMTHAIIGNIGKWPTFFS